MVYVNASELQARMGELLPLLRVGEQVLLRDAQGRVVARLVAADGGGVASAAVTGEPGTSASPDVPALRRGGVWRGRVWMADDFDGPLPPDVQAAFNGDAS